MITSVYIATAFQLIDEARRLRTVLEQDGIEVTSRWIDINGPAYQQQELADMDISDVMRAQAVVFINPLGYKNSGTGGRHFETGMAFMRGMPIFIYGERTNVFHSRIPNVSSDDPTLLTQLHSYNNRGYNNQQEPVGFEYFPGSLMIAELARRVHNANAKWWTDLHTGQPISRNVGELLMLVTSELAEAMEGHRKNLNDDKLPHRRMFDVELVDALIRLFDIIGGLSPEAAAAFDEKMIYNANREDHKVEHRRGEHGKKY